MKISLKALMVGFALVSTLFLSACHTTQGIGKDIAAGGKVIERAAS